MKLDLQQIKATLINFVVPIAALVITLLLILLVLIPAIKNAPTLRKELADAKLLEAQLQTKLTTLKKLEDFKEAVDENGKLLSRVLVDEAAVPELLTQIDMVAKQSGLDVTKLSYSFSDSAALLQEDVLEYKAVMINLGANGNYDQITTFLKNLEGSARLVDVKTYRFSEESTDDDSGLYSAVFVLRSPYLAVESSAVTDDPIEVDIASQQFIKSLSKIRELTFYDITADTKFVDLEESEAEEVEELPEEQIPEGEEVTQDVEELVEK